MGIVTELLRRAEAAPFPLFPCVELAALVLAGLVFERRLRRAGLSRRGPRLVAVAVGAVAGAIGLGIVLRMPRVLLGGGAGLFAPGLFMAYGGLLGACVGAFASARTRAHRVLALDALGPALGVLVAVGRLGCFFAGCCFGRASDAPWAVEHPEGTPAFAFHAATGDAGVALTPHLHPTALYEVLVGLVMIGVGLRVRPHVARARGLLAVLGTYAVGRFIVELFRGDPRPFAGPLSLPQWIGVGVLAVVVAKSASRPPAAIVG